MPIDLDAYFARIGYTGTPAADERTLAVLHEAHVGTIPFENLDVIWRRPIALDPDSLQAKLVEGGRGGYCFEQNTLFKAVLDRLGFATHILAARVRLSAAGVTPRTHMLLKVETRAGAMLADVGFGAVGLLRPLPLLPEIETSVPGAAYQLRHEAGVWILEAAVGSAEIMDLYAFTLEPHYPIDIEMANHYVSTHPRSHFRKTVTAQLTRADRRVTLRGTALTRQTGNAIVEEQLPDEAAVLAALATEFGLEFPAGTRLAPPDEARETTP
ncbi:MAG TPA: arylamine N-acetyltransferase [Stellaceae bacterium]|nr:arylamine N-acetyltransferase [Stellaceae bacterium]